MLRCFLDEDITSWQGSWKVLCSPRNLWKSNHLQVWKRNWKLWRWRPSYYFHHSNSCCWSRQSQPSRPSTNGEKGMQKMSNVMRRSSPLYRSAAVFSQKHVLWTPSDIWYICMYACVNVMVFAHWPVWGQLKIPPAHAQKVWNNSIWALEWIGLLTPRVSRVITKF